MDIEINICQIFQNMFVRHAGHHKFTWMVVFIFWGNISFSTVKSRKSNQVTKTIIGEIVMILKLRSPYFSSFTVWLQLDIYIVISVTFTSCFASPQFPTILQKHAEEFGFKYNP